MEYFHSYDPEYVTQRIKMDNPAFSRIQASDRALACVAGLIDNKSALRHEAHAFALDGYLFLGDADIVRDSFIDVSMCPSLLTTQPSPTTSIYQRDGPWSYPAVRQLKKPNPDFPEKTTTLSYNREVTLLCTKCQSQDEHLESTVPSSTSVAWPCSRQGD